MTDIEDDLAMMVYPLAKQVWVKIQHGTLAAPKIWRFDGPASLSGLPFVVKPTPKCSNTVTMNWTVSFLPGMKEISIGTKFQLPPSRANPEDPQISHGR
jgi:hypothetical protein